MTELEILSIVKETDGAFLCRIEDEDGDPSETWIPKSLVTGAETYGEGDEDVVIEVPTWFAEKEGLA